MKYIIILSAILSTSISFAHDFELSCQALIMKVSYKGVPSYDIHGNTHTGIARTVVKTSEKNGAKGIIVEALDAINVSYSFSVDWNSQGIKKITVNDEVNKTYQNITLANSEQKSLGFRFEAISEKDGKKYDSELMISCDINEI